MIQRTKQKGKRMNFGFVLIVFLMLFVTSPIARAQEDSFLELLKILRSNNNINQEQFEQIKKEFKSGSSLPPKSESDVKVETQGGIEIATYDGNFSFELGGRLIIDLAVYREDVNLMGGGTELRRARLEAEGTLFGEWGYEFGIDVASGEADVKDAYVLYQGFWPTVITIGQFKEPFSLEEITSSKSITFMERSLPNEFAPGRNMGIGVHTYGDHWTAAAGLFGESFDDDPGSEGEEGWALTGRLTVSPWHEDTKALHFGGAVSHRVTSDENEVTFDTRPESHITDLKFLNTDDISDVEDIQKYGAEFGWVAGPFSVQSEYFLVDLNRGMGLGDHSFNGWYVYGSWFLTGEPRDYKFKKGAFGSPKTRNKIGAWELAIRYSTVDLNDGPVLGGEEKNMTVGVNWYVNPNIRFMVNYILVNNDIHADDAGSVIGNDDPQVLQTRVQLVF